MIEKFNKVREQHQGELLTASEVSSLLKEVPRSSDRSFVSLLVTHGCINKVNKRYVFTKEPVYYKKLDAVISEIRKRTRESMKKYYHKTLNEEEALKLLLATGKYEIYRVTKEKL